MTGMMLVAQDTSTMTVHHDKSHHENLQPTGTMTHAQMMQSGDHGGAHDMTCELLCALSISQLPHIGFVPQIVHPGQLWPVPESPDYLSRLHALLYKPPRI